MRQRAYPDILQTRAYMAPKRPGEGGDMPKFSPETRLLLKASGWTEDWRVDVTEYEHALVSAGHEDCRSACDFLERYGNLGLEVNDVGGDTCLNTKMSEIMESGLVSSFSTEAARHLYVIGSCYFDFMSLLMDSAGR